MTDSVVCDVKYHDDMLSAILYDTKTVDFGDTPPNKIFESFTSVGGEKGWFNYNFL